MNDLEGVLGPSIIQFVQGHVRSLLTWDILVFFHRNPETELDVPSLSSRLGRRIEEVGPEVEALCERRILCNTDGAIGYSPDPEMHDSIASFVDACQDRGRRLALIALVLQKIGPPSQASEST